MKYKTTMFWLYLSLFLLQQVGIVSASSLQHHTHSQHSTKISCHHMMTKSDLNNKTCVSHSMHNKSCCKTGCHCGAMGCSSAFIMSAIVMQSIDTIHDSPDFIYVFSLSSAHDSSLFRPPISI